MTSDDVKIACTATVFKTYETKINGRTLRIRQTVNGWDISLFSNPNTDDYYTRPANFGYVNYNGIKSEELAFKIAAEILTAS